MKRRLKRPTESNHLVRAQQRHERRPCRFVVPFWQRDGIRLRVGQRSGTPKCPTLSFCFATRLALFFLLAPSLISLSALVSNCISDKRPTDHRLAVAFVLVCFAVHRRFIVTVSLVAVCFFFAADLLFAMVKRFFWALRKRTTRRVAFCRRHKLKRRRSRSGSSSQCGRKRVLWRLRERRRNRRQRTQRRWRVFGGFAVSDNQQKQTHV